MFNSTAFATLHSITAAETTENNERCLKKSNLFVVFRTTAETYNYTSAKQLLLLNRFVSHPLRCSLSKFLHEFRVTRTIGIIPTQHTHTQAHSRHSHQLPLEVSIFKFCVFYRANCSQTIIPMLTWITHFQALFSIYCCCFSGVVFFIYENKIWIAKHESAISLWIMRLLKRNAWKILRWFAITNRFSNHPWTSTSIGDRNSEFIRLDAVHMEARSIVSSCSFRLRYEAQSVGVCGVSAWCVYFVIQLSGLGLGENSF